MENKFRTILYLSNVALYKYLNPLFLVVSVNQFFRALGNKQATTFLSCSSIDSSFNQHQNDKTEQHAQHRGSQQTSSFYC